MASAEHRLNMAAMRDMTGMAILNFFSANSKFFHSDVKNAEHLGAEDRTKEREGERNVSSGSSMRFGSTLSISSHLSSSFPSFLFLSLSTATGIQNCNTRICCHWNSSLFPITSEWKFPLHFTKCRRKEREKSRRTRNLIYLYFIFISLFSEDKDICRCWRGECIRIWISGMVVAGM